MTEMELRQKVADTINAWVTNSGKGSPQHLDILNVYNTQKNLPYGYKVQVNDAFCATTVSAAFIRAGIADYTGTECSCPRFIEIAKTKGIWVENDAYVPKVGDAILYDWGDTGAGDNIGVADHIGIVTQAGTTTFVVTEGNMSGGKVGKRTMNVNGRYIRGYITPNYADIAAKIGGNTTQTTRPVVTAQQTTTSNVSNEKQIYDFFLNVLKLNTAAACGALANIEKESKFNPNVTGDRGTSYGICQWHAGRFTNLKNWSLTHGYDYTTLKGQLYFMKHELETVARTTLIALQKVSNTAEGAYDAGYAWCAKFEIPANVKVVAAERGNSAKNAYWPKYTTTATNTITHTIKFGDTLSAIAKAAGTTYMKLAEWNEIENPNFIRIGTKIYLTEVSAAIAKLASIKVIENPDYWFDTTKGDADINNVIIAAAKKITAAKTPAANLSTAVNNLVSAGVIDNAAKWNTITNAKTVTLIRELGGSIV